MPKMKVNPGAKKRYSLTGTGKLKRKHAYKSHLLTRKSKKRKRNLGYYTIINKDNLQSARHLLTLK